MSIRQPRNTVARLHDEIIAMAYMIYADAPTGYKRSIEHILDRVRIEVTDTRRGFARPRTITVPLWAWKRGVDYAHYYLAHEMAHVIAWLNGLPRGHGVHFQNILKSLTPYSHYELDYKPRMAAAAGISKPIGA